MQRDNFTKEFILKSFNYVPEEGIKLIYLTTQFILFFLSTWIEGKIKEKFWHTISLEKLCVNSV